MEKNKQVGPSIRLFRVFLLGLGLVLSFSSKSFSGEDDLFGDASSKHSPERHKGRGGQRVISESPMDNSFKNTFSGSLDARFISTDKDITWEEGGRGITRYGAVRDGKINTALSFQRPPWSLTPSGGIQWPPISTSNILTIPTTREK